MTATPVPAGRDVSANADTATGAPARSTTRVRGPALWLGMIAMATISFNSTRVAGWTVSDLFFLLCAGVIVIQSLTNDVRGLTPKGERRGSHLVLVGAIIMLTGSTISSFKSWTPLASMMVVVRMAWLTLVWFWILRTLCRDRAAFMDLIKSWRVTVILSAIAAVLGDSGIAFESTNFDAGRQAAFTFHPGELMNFLITGLFLFLVPIFLPANTSRPQRAMLGSVAGVVIVSLAIFATGSTSALLALAAGGMAIAAVVAFGSTSRRQNRRRSPLAMLVLVGACIVGLMALMSSDLPIVQRLTGTNTLDTSIASRSDSNQEILGDFDEYLVFGIGPFFGSGGASSLASSQFTSTGEVHNGVHNMHLKMIYEAGLPALVGFWIIILAVGRQATRLTLACRGTDLYPISLALLGGFVAANTSSMFGPTAYARHFWLPFALIGCLWSVRRRELREAAGPDVGPAGVQARSSRPRIG